MGRVLAAKMMVERTPAVVAVFIVDVGDGGASDRS
jgi:hypothetical protein